MTRTRIPWPWENKPLPPADAAVLLANWREHAATHYPDQPDEPDTIPPLLGVSSGDGAELAGVRDTAAAMERDILDMTDRTPAAREWARDKAHHARDFYHHAVHAGREPRPTKR